MVLVVNPKTGRNIDTTKATFKKLISEGYTYNADQNILTKSGKSATKTGKSATKSGKKYTLKQVQNLLSDEEIRLVCNEIGVKVIKQSKQSKQTSSKQTSSKQQELNEELFALVKGLNMDYDEIDTLQKLLDKGADPDSRDELGRIPLHYARVYFYRQKGKEWWEHVTSKNLRLLIENTSDLNARDNNGKTPLHALATKFDTSDHDFDTPVAVRMLIEAGADPNLQDIHGNTPLHYAIITETDYQMNTIEVLLKYGANPNIQNNEGDTPAHLAGFMEDSSAMEHLILKDTDFTIRNNYNNTPIGAFYENNDIGNEFFEETILKYLDIFDPNTKFEGGNTLLHFLADYKDPDFITKVIRKNAKANIKNDEGKTAIDLAREENMDENVIRMKRSIGSTIKSAKKKRLKNKNEKTKKIIN